MKKDRVLYLIFGGLIVSFSIIMTVFTIIGFIRNEMPLWYFVMFAIYIASGIFSAYLMAKLYRKYKTTKNRSEANFREFSVNTTFNDRLSFSEEIGHKVQRHKHKSAIISFTVFSLTEKYQYFQSVRIREFYGTVIKYLEALHRLKGMHHRLYAGFDADTFFLYYIYNNADELTNFISKIDNDMYTLFSKADVHVNMHPSFGIYELSSEEKDVHQMIENSLLSLRISINSYQVVVFYDKGLSNQQVHNDVLEQEIKRGIENHEFMVYYQPKFDLATNKFVGAEALIRWQHPQKGLFNPGAFIGECEKSGLIHVIDFYVFDQVCQDLGDWKKRGRRMMPISTNFSSYDFYRPDFIESVMSTIDANSIAPNYLEVEITESSTANNYFYVMSILKRLKDMNIRILMDDFGTGFSTLGNLRKYPINALKIDKSFIDGIADDIKSREICGTIISLSKSLGLESIAEGVQTEKQVQILRELKCNEIQGFYYSKPLTKKDFEVFLATNEFEKKEVIL